MDKASLDYVVDALGQSGRTAVDMKPLEVISTGFPGLDDHLLGIGGLPRGKIIELYAIESAGKSTIAYNIIGNIQKAGGLCALFDAEAALTKDKKSDTLKYAEGCGVDSNQLIYPEFGVGEDLCHKMKLLIALNKLDLIVLDSLNAITPQTKLEADDPNMRDRLSAAVMWKDFFESLDGGYLIKDREGKPILSRQSREVFVPSKGKMLITNELHKLKDTKTSIIIINHEMTKIGQTWGAKDYTPGGSRKNFMFAIRLRATLKHTKTGKSKGETVLKYKEIEIKAKKNKLAVPTAYRFLLYPDGKMAEIEGSATTVEESEGTHSLGDLSNTINLGEDNGNTD